MSVRQGEKEGETTALRLVTLDLLTRGKKRGTDLHASAVHSYADVYSLQSECISILVHIYILLH